MKMLDAHKCALVSTIAASGQRPAASSRRETGMNLLEPLTELLIFSREHGGDELPEVERAIRAVESKIDGLRSTRRRRDARRYQRHCEVCDFRSVNMLCVSCAEKAPAEIRDAFKNACGLDGMRLATEMIRDYANEKHGMGRRAA